MRKILVIAMAVLALAFSACKDSSEDEVDIGIYTGSKNGIDYVLTISPAKLVHSIGDPFTFTASGNGAEKICTGRVAGIADTSDGFVYTLQPSEQGAPTFSVNTIDINIVFIDETITWNGGATEQAPGSLSPESETKANSGGSTGGGGGGHGGANVSPPVSTTYTITIQNDGHGSATVSPNPASPGDLITISENPGDHYKFKEWQVISGAVALSPDIYATVAKFTMPASDVAIKAIFEALSPGEPYLTLVPGLLDLGTAEFGYALPAPVDIKIHNSGDVSATVASTVMGGTNPGSFTLGAIPATVPANSDTETFTVQPVTGLAIGSYSASITITYDGGKFDTTSVSFTVTSATKGVGEAVSAPTTYTATSSSITVVAVTSPANGQGVEYAYSTVNSPPASGWQSGTTFSGLSPGTTYYVFARSGEDANYHTGAPSSTGLTVATLPPTIALVGGDFSLPEAGREDKQLTVTVDPVGAGVTWSSSDTSVATVTDGLVETLNPGTAIITATVTGFSVSDSITVYVEPVAWHSDVRGDTPSLNNVDGSLILDAGDPYKFTLKGKGTSAVGSQTFSFVFLKVTGDFTMTARLDGPITWGVTSTTSIAAVVGLMAIPQDSMSEVVPGKLTNVATGRGLYYASNIFAAGYTGGAVQNRTVRLRYRDEVLQGSTNSQYDYKETPLASPTVSLSEITGSQIWLKLRRTGNVFTAELGESIDNGASWTWTQVAGETVPMISDAYVGLWVTGGNGSNNGGYTEATFSDWRIVHNGNASDAALHDPGARIDTTHFAEYRDDL